MAVTRPELIQFHPALQSLFREVSRARSEGAPGIGSRGHVTGGKISGAVGSAGVWMLQEREVP